MVLLIGVLSCRTNRVDSYEMKVFNEIFDNLVEEMGALDRFEIPPPPIPFFDNNNPMAYDTVRYEQKITEIERENMKMKDTLNLSEIENRKRFILKHFSEFPEGFKIWERENYNFLFSGILRMSRIYFNKEKLVGVFYCSYAGGRLCGEEAIICIRKINDKWIIEKNILLGVS